MNVDILRRSFGDWRVVLTLQWDGRTLRGKGNAGLTRPDLRQLAACLGRGEPVGWITHDAAYMVPDWCPQPAPPEPAPAPVREPPPSNDDALTDAQRLGLAGEVTAEAVRRRQRELSRELADAADRLIATMEPAKEERWNPDLDEVFA